MEKKKKSNSNNKKPKIWKKCKNLGKKMEINKKLDHRFKIKIQSMD